MATFAAMLVAVYAPLLLPRQGTDLGRLIVQTLLFHIKSQFEHSLVLLTLDKQSGGPISKNIEEIMIKSPPRTAIGKKIWWDITLPKTLKKLKAGFFISIGDRCSLTISIPQSLVILDSKVSGRRSLQMAGSVVVANKPIQKLIKEKYNVPNEKIFALQPFSDPDFVPLNDTQKQIIKDKYAAGREFFLYNGSVHNEQTLEVLKAYSLFKKRQQSNLKLSIFGSAGSALKASLSNYKYKDDVVCVTTTDKNIIAQLMASSYAVLLPFNSGVDSFVALNAMNAGSPVITVKDTAINDIAGEAALYAETISPKDISEKMMQIYINENLRSSLVEKGKSIANEYTLSKAADLLWKAFMKALN